MNYKKGIYGAVFFLLVSVLLTGIRCSSPPPKRITIRYVDHKAIALVIRGAGMRSSAVNIKRSQTATSIAGGITSEQRDLIFTPFIPFTPGFSYDVIFGSELFGTIVIPYPVEGTPQVVAIYPSADSIPENLLKIYLHFSQPMREAQSVANIAMLDSEGDTVKGAFLDLQQELWNEDRTQLTLWLDPGRIKRGLKPNLALGPPLMKGRKYKLVVNPKWTDYLGRPLKQVYQKTYFTSERQDAVLDPARWIIRVPKRGTQDSLVIVFPEPLDFSLLHRTISLEDNAGIPLNKIRITNHERRFSFIPDELWKDVGYKIEVKTFLEDLAGNNLLRPFDRDLTLPETKLKLTDGNYLMMIHPR